MIATTSRITTKSEELNKFLGGGFKRGCVYLVAGASGQFKSGFVKNILFQSDKKDSVGLLSSETDLHMLRILSRDYFVKPDAFKTGRYQYSQKVYHEDTSVIQKMLSEVDDILILENIYLLGQTMRESLELTVTMMADIAKRTGKTILITMQTNHGTRPEEFYRSLGELSRYCDTIYVKHKRTGNRRVVLFKGKNRVSLRFENNFKII